MKWFVAEVECAICGREWFALFPESASMLECSNCGYKNNIPDDADEVPEAYAREVHQKQGVPFFESGS